VAHAAVTDIARALRAAFETVGTASRSPLEPGDSPSPADQAAPPRSTRGRVFR